MFELWVNMCGSYEVVPVGNDYRFGFWSSLIGTYASEEEAYAAIPEESACYGGGS